MKKFLIFVLGAVAITTILLHKKTPRLKQNRGSKEDDIIRASLKRDDEVPPKYLH